MLGTIFITTIAGLASAEARTQEPLAQPRPRAEQLAAAPGLSLADRTPPPDVGGGAVDTANFFYDNGDADGSHAYSNGTASALGARRTLLDDFSTTVVRSQYALRWTHIWSSGQAPLGTGAEVQIREDASGSPGAVLVVADVTSYWETSTGRVFFSRPEAVSCVTLGGFGTSTHATYWFEATIVGPEENLWLVHSSIKGSECWVNYEDHGGLRPGSDLFGAPADLNFRLIERCACSQCPEPFDPFFDNGAPDGSNGYSNGPPDAIGVFRRLLDDFVLPADAGLTGLRWWHVWDGDVALPTGSYAQFRLRSDASGAPGAVFTVPFVDEYCEEGTGRVFFDRPEVVATVTFHARTPLTGGVRYWIDGFADGPVGSLWLVHSGVTGTECWVDYADMGGLQPGSAVYGAPADLSFTLEAKPLDGDNGDTDGSNAYSNFTEDWFGIRRTLLDDFVVARPATLTHLASNHLWNVEHYVPFGTGAEIVLRADAGGSPGAVLTPNLVVEHCEAPTGRRFFERFEVESVVRLEPVHLDPGTYWLEGVMVSPPPYDNNFWLVRASITGSECWVDYDDLGGFQPGSAVFGVQADLNFSITLVDDVGTTFCDPLDGSIHNTATLSASSASLAEGVTLDLSGGPPGEFGYLLLGNGNALVHQPPGSEGDLCVTGGSCLGRYAEDVGPISTAGTLSTDIESSASGGPGYGIPTCGGHIASGETWYFQYWHRQPMAPSTFSQALAVTFVD